MKVTREYEIAVDEMGNLEYFINTMQLPRELVSLLVDTCTRYLDAGDIKPLYLQQEATRLDWKERPPEYTWVIAMDLDRDPARKPIYGPVEWHGKELDYGIEW